MRKLLCLLFAAASVTFCGCGQDKPTQPCGESPSDDVIMPLKIGHRWDGNYRYIRPVEPYDTVVTRLDYEIVDTISYAGIVWYETVGWFDDSSVYSVHFYANREDGLWEFNLIFNRQGHYLFAKYPANVGDTFYTGEENQYAVIVESIDTLAIRTPACVDCPRIIYRYRLPNPGMIEGPDYCYYFSPGFGPIGWEYIDPFHMNNYRSWEMIDFIPDISSVNND